MKTVPYLFIHVVHPEAQGLPDRWVTVPAARLRPQQASLLQVVQGQDVLVAVRLQERPFGLDVRSGEGFL